MCLTSSRLIIGWKLWGVWSLEENHSKSHIWTPSLSAGPGVPEEDLHTEAEETLGEPEDEGGDDHCVGAGGTSDPRRHHLRHRQQHWRTVAGPWLGEREWTKERPELRPLPTTTPLVTSLFMELFVPQRRVSVDMVPVVQGCCQALSQNLGVEPGHILSSSSTLIQLLHSFILAFNW